MGSRYLAKVAVAVLLSLGAIFLSGQSTHVAATAPSDYCYYWYSGCSYYDYYYGYYPYCSSSYQYYYGYCGSNFYSYPYYGSYGYSSYYGTPAQYQLTVATDPPTIGSVSGGGTYSQGSSASFSISQNTVQISETSRYVFSHWSGDYSGVGTSGSLTMNGASKVTAVYQLQYYLDVSVQPQSAPLPQGAGWYNAGDTVNLNSVGQFSGGQDGSRIVFQGWSVDGQTQTGTSLTVQMNSPHQVITQYKQQYYLKVIADQGASYGEGWYDAGATAPIYASTPSSPSYGVSMIFNSWQGDIQSNSQSATVLMDGPKTAIATWRSDPTILYLTIGAAILTVALIGTAVLAYLTSNRNRNPQRTTALVPTRTETVTSSPQTPAKQRTVPLRGKQATHQTQQTTETTT